MITPNEEPLNKLKYYQITGRGERDLEKLSELTLEEKKEALAFIKRVLSKEEHTKEVFYYNGICTIYKIWLLKEKGLSPFKFTWALQDDVIYKTFPELMQLIKIKTTSSISSYWFNNAEERLNALNTIKL